MTREPNAQTARRLYAGLNGDADQRAATALLAGAGCGVWLGKLAGWPQYMRPLDDTRHPDALYLDWHQLREDLIADDRAWATFNDWSTSYAGRQASDDEYERRLANNGAAQAVARRQQLGARPAAHRSRTRPRRAARRRHRPTRHPESSSRPGSRPRSGRALTSQAHAVARVGRGTASWQHHASEGASHDLRFRPEDGIA